MTYTLCKEPLVEVLEQGFLIRIKEEEKVVSPLMWQTLQKIAYVTHGNSNIRCYKERLLPLFRDEDYLISSQEKRLCQYISMARQIFCESIGNRLIQGNCKNGYYISLKNSRDTLWESYAPIKLDESELKYCFEEAFNRVTKLLITKAKTIKQGKIGQSQRVGLNALLRVCESQYTSRNLYAILNRLKTRRIDIEPRQNMNI